MTQDGKQAIELCIKKVTKRFRIFSGMFLIGNSKMFAKILLEWVRQLHPRASFLCFVLEVLQSGASMCVKKIRYLDPTAMVVKLSYVVCYLSCMFLSLSDLVLDGF